MTPDEAVKDMADPVAKLRRDIIRLNGARDRVRLYIEIGVPEIGTRQARFDADLRLILDALDIISPRSPPVMTPALARIGAQLNRRKRQ